jgi:DNA-binding transcriptional LysR family regulator
MHLNPLMNRLRMKQVALMLEIETTGTLSLAARQIGMTQPAATKMLAELESALGKKLFDRIGRDLQMNAVGKHVLQSFRGLHGTLEQLQRDLQELELGSAGQLVLGSIMAASPAYLTRALVKLKTMHPAMSVKIEVGTNDRLMQLLDAGELDLVIGRVPGALSAYRFRPLAEEDIAIVCSSNHILTLEKSPTFSRLCDFPWILQPTGNPLRDVVSQEFAKYHAPMPKGLMETSSTLITTYLVSRTQMISVLPQSVSQEFQQHGMISVVDYSPSNKLASYGSVVRLDRPISIQTEHFLNYLHEGESFYETSH